MWWVNEHRRYDILKLQQMVSDQRVRLGLSLRSSHAWMKGLNRGGASKNNIWPAVGTRLLRGLQATQSDQLIRIMLLNNSLRICLSDIKLSRRPSEEHLGGFMISLLWPSGQAALIWRRPLQWCFSNSTPNLPFCHFNLLRLLASEGMKKNSFIKTMLNLSSVLCLCVWRIYSKQGVGCMPVMPPLRLRPD